MSHYITKQTKLNIYIPTAYFILHFIFMEHKIIQIDNCQLLVNDQSFLFDSYIHKFFIHINFLIVIYYKGYFFYDLINKTGKCILANSQGIYYNIDRLVTDQYIIVITDNIIYICQFDGNPVESYISHPTFLRNIHITPKHIIISFQTYQTSKINIHVRKNTQIYINQQKISFTFKNHKFVSSIYRTQLSLNKIKLKAIEPDDTIQFIHNSYHIQNISLNYLQYIDSQKTLIKHQLIQTPLISLKYHPCPLISDLWNELSS